AAELALSAQISGLMGAQSAELFRATLESASNQTSGTWAAIVGLVTLLATASGVFGEMQLALNTIWKVEPTDTSLSRIVRARAASLGLVAALGFLLLVSLIASAAISALAATLNAYLPFGEAIASVLNTILSFVLTAVLFAAIYKLLPDRSLAWRDVGLGALVTAALFTVGKSAIGWYLGANREASPGSRSWSRPAPAQSLRSCSLGSAARIHDRAAKYCLIANGVLKEATVATPPVRATTYVIARSAGCS
ncbi:MAG: hypothetical protein E5V60_19370, partial [Mesorhizobium sp.]